MFHPLRHTAGIYLFDFSDKCLEWASVFARVSSQQLLWVSLRVLIIAIQDLRH